MKALQVLTVLVLLLTLCHAIQTEYFVKPNENTPCPGLPCHTFSHFLESTTQYSASNTKISFLPGVHFVEKVSVLQFVKVSNLTLAGYMSISHAAKNAKIVCLKPATLVFWKIVNLVIKNLSIIYCGYPLLNDGKGSSAALRMVEIISLKISSISVENSTGYGIMGGHF